MSALPNSPLLIWYNGVLFPTEVESSVVERPIEDDSKRTIKMVVYTISVKATLGQSSQPATTDATMASLRQRLNVNGGELHYEGVGYGAIIANIPPAGATVGNTSSARDVIWGPKAKVMKWTPKGQLAAEVEWQVEVALAPCENAAYIGAILEYVYSVSWSVPANGYDKRTIKGSISIAQTRLAVDSTALVDNADRLREQITPSVPVGYQRTNQDFELSKDKCTLSFAFVDEQRGPFYPPPGVVTVKMNDGASIREVKLGGQWTGSCRATYEMVRGASQLIAVGHFLFCIANRRQAALDNPQPAPGQRGGSGTQSFFLLSFNFGNVDRYGPPMVEIAATYRFLANIQTVFAASGVFRPVPNSDWQRWAFSVTANGNVSAKSPWGPRGNGGLRFDGSQEAIIDLCHQPGGSYITPIPTGSTGEPSPDGTPPDGFPSGDPFTNDYPDPDTSWLEYESDVWIEEIDEVIPLKPLPPPDFQGGVIRTPPPPPATQPGGGSSSGGIPDLGGGNLRSTPASSLDAGGSSGPVPDSGIPVSSSGLDGSDAGTTTVIVQRRGAPTFYATLSGRAMRAGYPIAPPKLTSVGGVGVSPCNESGYGFAQRLSEVKFGVPVYMAVWRFRYLLNGTPAGNIAVMDTPMADG